MAIKEGNCRIQITLSQVTLAQLDELCEEQGVTRSAVITQAIREMRWDSLQRKLTERRAKESSEE